MGSGASAETKSALAGASVDDVKSFVEGLPDADKDKIKAVFATAAVAPAAPAASEPAAAPPSAEQPAGGSSSKDSDPAEPAASKSAAAPPPAKQPEGYSSSKDIDPAEPVASKPAAAPPSAEQPADDSPSKDPEPSEFMGCYHGGYYPTVDLKFCQDMRAELRQKEMDDDSHNDGLCYIGLKYFYGTWKLEVRGKRRPVVSVTFACMREGSASTFGGATVGEKDIDSWKQRPVSEACAFGAGVLAPLPGSESFQPACDMKKTPSEPHLAVPEDLAIAFEAPAQPAQGEPPEGSGDSEASVAGTYGPVGAPQMELREDGRIKHTSPRLIRHGTWQLVHPRILEVHWTESIELDADGAEESKSQTDRLEGMYYGGKVIRTSGTGGIFNREGA